MIKGHLWSTCGKSLNEIMFCGGTIFMDHAFSLIHVEHQVSLGANNTLIAKIAFKWRALTHGVGIQAYHGDN